MKTISTHMKYGNIILLILAILFTGCSVPEKIAKDASILNIENDKGVNGTKMRLFLQVGSDIKSILSWEHFLNFKNFDIIAVDTGTIKAATVSLKSAVLPGQTVTPSMFLDATKMGFDGGIFLCSINFDSLATNGLHLSTPVDSVNGYPAYNLNSGLSFRLDNSVTIPVKVKFKLYGITAGIEKELDSDELSFTFYNTQHTTTSIENFDSVPVSDTVMATTRDSLFAYLLSDLKNYEANARVNSNNNGLDIFSLKLFHKDEDENGNGYDSLHIKTINDSLKAVETVIKACGTVSCTTFVYNSAKDSYPLYSVGDTVPVGSCEKSIMHASAQNAKVILANRLIHIIAPTYVFPSTQGGTALKTIPPVGPGMDSYFGLYSNISGLLEVLNDFKNGWALQKDNESDQLQKNLKSYLKNVVGSDDLNGLNPSAFSHLILWYTDYLLYAGLCSYIDNDFFSRYINHHKLLLDELKTLVDKVAPEYNNNNIVIRFYAVATLYDFLLAQDNGYLKSFTGYLEKYVDSSGEYGEGFGYLNYVSEILLPVVYIGMQETYLQGANSGQNWLPDTSMFVTLYKSIANNLINVANNWAEIPALDDACTTIPYLAPFAQITSESKYVQYTKEIKSLLDKGMYSNLESAETVGMQGNPVWQMFLYPYNKTFAGSSIWKHSLDSVRHVGSIVQIPAGNDTNMLNMSFIAEEDPEAGGTHDQIDHGAIQFTRYKNNGAGTNPHVDHLIIDPGYPGFSDNKRYRNEWQYCNQNVQMLWDSDTSFSTDETLGWQSRVSEQPHENADNEEIYGNRDGSDMNTEEKMHFRENGGMTGYRYLSPWSMREIVHKYVLKDAAMQNNMWEAVDAQMMMKIKNKTLSPKGGQGKSQVIEQYKNGVEVRIDYKYPKKQEIFKFEESAWWNGAKFYYGREIEYNESHHGIRGVYTLGNNYYVIDHLPEDNLPSSISLGNSWNMPRNTTQLGSFGWQRFVFEGTTPDSIRTPFPAQSRIEIAVTGAKGVTAVIDSFEVHKFDTLRANHLTFENDLSTNNFMITQFRVSDISINLPSIVAQQEDSTTISGGIVWARSYSDNSRDLVVYNPEQDTNTVLGITSNAKVWLLHAGNTSNWTIGRLYGASVGPTFSGFTPTPTVTAHRITPSSEAQYEITF